MPTAREKAEEAAFGLYLADYHTGSQLVKRLTKAERNRFEAIIKQLKADTKFELSEVEYFWLAKTQYFCEFVESEILVDGLQKCPQAVLKFYEAARKDVLDAMRRYREGKVAVNSSIEGLKKAIQDLVDEKGAIKATPRKDFVTVSREPAEADPESGGGLDDSDPVLDAEGDSGPAEQTHS